MRFKVGSSPHVHSGGSVSRVMHEVLLALLPGIALYVFFFGWGILFQLAIASFFALAAETWLLWLRGQPIRTHLEEESALVTAFLLALAIPPVSPWWVAALGAAFAIVFGKQLYGGLGYNPFNPAMVGYVMLLIAFPREMTLWLPPATVSPHGLSFLDTARLILTGHPPAHLALDALTSATPLDAMRTQLSLGKTLSEVKANPLFGDFGGKGWEWLGNAFFLGGLWLIYRKVITWHIPFAVLASLIAIATPFYVWDSDAHPSPLFHVFSGAAILGAFFIATDPITASTTPRGKLIYGAGIGLLIYIIRTFGGYPDGVAFAVLLMNMAVPTIDHYTKPRVFGHPP